VRGTEPHTFYSILDEGFTGILADRYPGLHFRRLIPCDCAEPPDPPCSHEFDYTTVQKALERRVDLQCQQTLASVDPRAFLLGLQALPVETTLDEITCGISKIEASTSRIEQSQLQTLDTVRDLLRYRAEQGVYCPSIFTVTPKRGDSASAAMNSACSANNPTVPIRSPTVPASTSSPISVVAS
jgi:internalin A